MLPCRGERLLQSMSGRMAMQYWTQPGERRLSHVQSRHQLFTLACKDAWGKKDTRCIFWSDGACMDSKVLQWAAVTLWFTDSDESPRLSDCLAWRSSNKRQIIWTRSECAHDQCCHDTRLLRPLRLAARWSFKMSNWVSRAAGLPHSFHKAAKRPPLRSSCHNPLAQ